MKKTISVLGLGYVGLPTALLLADAENKVDGFDIDKEKINKLKRKKLPFSERGLGKLFAKVIKKKTFTPSSTLQLADVFIIAVPTPQINKRADLKYVFKALDLIRDVFKSGDTIIIESTVGPRDCTDRIIPYISKWGQMFQFAHCPERAIPGNTLFEMINNQRIVGSENRKTALAVKKLYSSFVKGKINISNTTIAASAKIMENTYRSVNIALANEFAQIAHDLNFNIWKSIELANKHPRVHIHQPGPGVGGHCIPIDPWFFVGDGNGASLIEAALEKNISMSKYIASKLKKNIKMLGITKPVIGVLGYSYKKNVDDFRETPAEPLIKLLEKKFSVLTSDPKVNSAKRKMLPLREVLFKSTVIVLITDHSEYKKIKFAKHPNIKLVYDTRNLFTQNNFEDSSAKHLVL